MMMWTWCNNDYVVVSHALWLSFFCKPLLLRELVLDFCSCCSIHAPATEKPWIVSQSSTMCFSKVIAIPLLERHKRAMPKRTARHHHLLLHQLLIVSDPILLLIFSTLPWELTTSLLRSLERAGNSRHLLQISCHDSVFWTTLKYTPPKNFHPPSRPWNSNIQHIQQQLLTTVSRTSVFISFIGT